jgi:osmoprotectant transport system permease protein
MAGIRVAVVLNIGVTAIAAYIGAGGLGLLIRGGITQTDPRQVIAGALAVSLLALAADWLLGRTERWLTPRGMIGVRAA